MDTCKFCGSTITERYFRVRTQIACAACARVVAEEANRDPTPFILRGILFAFLAAFGGALIRGAFEGIIGLAGDAGNFIAMFMRWFVLVTIASIIVKGAKAGSSGKGAVALQLFSAAFFYLAVSLAFVPVILFRNPHLPRNLKTLLALSILCIELPFSSILRNPINITGLIAIIICVGIVWSGTAAAPDPVDGPFEPAKPGDEPNFFKRKAALPSSQL